MNKHKKIIIFLLVLINLFLVAGLTVKLPVSYPKPPGNEFLPENLSHLQRKDWTKLIDKLGAEKAYAQLKSQMQDKSLKTQHVAAHLFGDVLYEKKGFEGMSVCDGSFAYGCYHVFVARVLAEKGLQMIAKLDKICVKKYGPRMLGCQHGIGHGILEYFGYKYENILDALKYCDQTTGNRSNPFLSCLTGVFMEHNMPVVTTDDIPVIDWRKFDPNDPYYPCPTIPYEFQKECYSQLGLWWNTVLNADYQKIGQLCQGIKDSENQSICFHSLGIFGATMAAYDVSETIKKCSLMPNEKSFLYCRSGAYQSFKSYQPKANEANNVCDGLNKVDREYCIRGKYWEGNLNNNIREKNTKL